MARAIAASVCDLIGSTPIVLLRRLAENLPVRLYGKCEFMNPGGSIKDRIGVEMILDAERKGSLRPGGTIVEATAGNTGMGLALVAAQRGYKLAAFMTTKMSLEKVNLLRAFGAMIFICPYGVPPSSPEHFIARAKAFADTTPGAWYADQFANESNVRAHFKVTGPEIWEQMQGDIDVIVAGIGTGGTLAGVGRYLKSKKPSIKIVLADPDGSIHKDTIEGKPGAVGRPYLVEGIGGDFVPPIADLGIVDRAITVPDAVAVSMAITAFRSEGLFLGASSGCILAAAIEYCRNATCADESVLAILPDGGRSYLSTIYDPSWRKSKLDLE